MPEPAQHGVHFFPSEAAHPLWRVRTGDYRIVYEIEDDRLLILVLRIGHGREIYLAP
jgi:mRNA-degrading endonuclease RelE of RelBE toxin-antitoxin system